MPQITVHHLEESRSQRVLWLLEELDVDYDVKRYARTRAGRAPRELRAVHPLGRAPVVTHGGEVLAESGAMVEYILDTFADGRLRPEPGSEELSRHRFYMHFAEGSMMAPLLVKLIMARMKKAIPLLGRVVAGRVDSAYTDPEFARTSSSSRTRSRAGSGSPVSSAAPTS